MIMMVVVIVVEVHQLHDFTASAELLLVSRWAAMKSKSSLWSILIAT